MVLEARSDLTSSYVLYGLGGVGKTQIAIEYSYRHRTDFDIIYWLRADNYETLLSSYLHLYNDPSFKAFTNLNLGDETNLETVAMRIKSWFESCQDITWLLIVDNADNLESIVDDNQSQNPKVKTIASLIPKGYRGCVLVTSRNRSANGQLAIMGEKLDVMDKDNAKSFLLKCSQAASNESEQAGHLVETLGRLPLAIEQAGGFMRENGISIAEYRELYKSNQSRALKEGLSTAHKELYYYETVATTWDVSFKAIEQTDPLAIVILRISSFLDGKQIQKDLFYDANLEVCGSEGRRSDWEVNKSFGTLMSYSLVHPVKDKQSVEMHRLVQDVICDVTKTKQVQWFTASAELVRRRFPWGGDLDNLNPCIKYLSQARSCVMHAQELQITSPIITYLLESMAVYLDVTGQYGEAFVTYKRALEIRDHNFGLDHIDSAGIIMGIGNIYDSQGEYDEAIAQYERALRIKEKAFGVDHINTADTINNSASHIDSQGKYDEAIAQYERALRI